MPKVYLVTYEFKDPEAKDYSGLIEQLKTFKWWHYLKNTWLIVSDLTAQRVYERLKPHIDENVNLLIIEVGKDRQGWLPEKAWEWIRENIGPNPSSLPSTTASSSS